MKKNKKKPLKRKNTTVHKIGLPPGSLIHDGEIIVDKPEIAVTDYSSDSVEHVILRNPSDLYPFMENTRANSYEDLHILKRKFIQMRRYISPIHEVLTALVRDDSVLITEEVKIYFRDVHDHMNRVSENLEHLIEITSTMFETHMTQVNIRTGEVMKVLTIIATIFIPLTFVVGIYGMNFNTASSPYNMPELNWYYGYPTVMGTMLVLTLGMLYFFRRKGWI